MKKITVAILSLICFSMWMVIIFASVNLNFEVPKEKAKLAINLLLQSSFKSSAWTKRANNFPAKNDNKPLADFPIKKDRGEVLSDSTANPAANSQLNLQEALDLSRPAVVSIVNHTFGSIEIPDFDVDLKTFELTARTDLPIHNFQPDSWAYGSGFFVNDQGYIATNSHVVDKKTAYADLETEIITHAEDVYKYELSQATDQQYKTIQDYLNKKYGTDSGSTDRLAAEIQAQVDDYIKKNSEDKNLQQQLVVIDPSENPNVLTKGQELVGAFNSGMPAKIISFNQNYETDGQDVALVKIDQSDTPALPLGKSDSVNSGMNILVVGYPFKAQVDSADIFKPTVTQGIITSVKTHKNQKLFELDNKISEGSSGSPLLDDQGNVIGIITYESSGVGSGDNFGYALPVELVSAMLAGNNVSNNLGIFGTNFIAGLALLHEDVCQKAIANFNHAQQTNSHFPTDASVKNYISQCQDLISNRQSKDGAYDVARIYFQTHPTNAVIFSLLMIILLIFIFTLGKIGLDHLKKQKTLSAFPRVPMPNM